jgi:hypothetical protein
MSDPSILSPEQLDEFHHRGVLRLDGLLSPDRVSAAREVVLRRLARHGLWQDGGWRLGPRLQWPDHGLKTSKVIGNKHPELEALIADPTLRALVDGLIDGRPLDRTAYARPMVLCTLPNAEVWRLPGGWHADCPRLASGRSPGVQVFTFLEPVGPRGGGTLVIAGSHRLMNEGRHIRPRDFPRHLGGEAFFRDLFSPGITGAQDCEVLPSGAVDGVPLEVLELSGEPGDVWLTDLRLLHTGAPNAADHPRLMVTYRFVRDDVSREVAEAWGWVRPAVAETLGAGQRAPDRPLR